MERLISELVWHEGDVVRKLRTVRHWTLEQLARASNVNVQIIHRLESGKTKEPKRATLDRLAGAFGVTSRQLLDLVPPKSHIDIERRAEPRPDVHRPSALRSLGQRKASR